MGVWCRLLIMRVSLLSSLLFVTVSSYRSYSGYQVLRTGELTKEQAELLREEQNDSMLDFWRDPAPGRSADIMASASELESVMAWLTSKDITFHTMVEDVEQLIQDSKPSPKSGKSARKKYTMDWDDYHELDVLNEFIESLADTNDFASIIPIGKSYEGRTSVTLSRPWTLYPCWATASTPTPSCGCGPMAMVTMPTLRTRRRYSSWP